MCPQYLFLSAPLNPSSQTLPNSPHQGTVPQRGPILGSHTSPKGMAQASTSPCPNLPPLPKFPPGSAKATTVQCCTGLVRLHLPFPLPNLGHYARLLQPVSGTCRLKKPKVKESGHFQTPHQSKLPWLKGFGKTSKLVKMKLILPRRRRSGVKHSLGHLPFLVLLM